MTTYVRSLGLTYVGQLACGSPFWCVSQALVGRRKLATQTYDNREIGIRFKYDKSSYLKRMPISVMIYIQK